MWYQSSNIPTNLFKGIWWLSHKHAYREKERNSQKLKVSLDHFNYLCLVTWKYFHTFHYCINFIIDISHLMSCIKYWNNFYTSAMISSIVKLPLKCWIWNTLIWIMNDIIYFDCTYTQENTYTSESCIQSLKVNINFIVQILILYTDTCKKIIKLMWYL